MGKGSIASAPLDLTDAPESRSDAIREVLKSQWGFHPPLWARADWARAAEPCPRASAPTPANSAPASGWAFGQRPPTPSRAFLSLNSRKNAVLGLTLCFSQDPLPGVHKSALSTQRKHAKANWQDFFLQFSSRKDLLEETSLEVSYCIFSPRWFSVPSGKCQLTCVPVLAVTSAAAPVGGPGPGHLGIPGCWDTRLAQAVLRRWTLRPKVWLSCTPKVLCFLTYSSGSSIGGKKYCSRSGFAGRIIAI